MTAFYTPMLLRDELWELSHYARYCSFNNDMAGLILNAFNLYYIKITAAIHTAATGCISQITMIREEKVNLAYSDNQILPDIQHALIQVFD
ncbi:MAG: hypothetical protein OXC48_05330 [Endozoicomonadaceae bacterium]|nr:hypothetical protein [Endozoicomonadaceae bacterium]